MLSSVGTATGPHRDGTNKDVPFITDHLRLVEFQWPWKECTMRAAQGLMKERHALPKHDLHRRLFAIQMGSRGFSIGWMFSSSVWMFRCPWEF